MSTAPNALSATEAARHIREGRLSSVDLVKSCLQRISETEPTLRAWASLEEEAALKQAAEMDRIRKAGRPIGALHGVPVALKDIVDTKDLPTERGTPIFSGRRPTHDAAIVERLTDAGAVILGKTVTTELAFAHPAVTRNPHNPDYSPGGSSSGSAAAVAAFNVPLAIGTQTNGSVIRPASYCGIFGLKPTRGVVSRRGILQTSVTLDQVGCFGRTLEDAALLCDAVKGYDPSDTMSYPRPRPDMGAGVQAEAPVKPSLVWLEMPYHDKLTSDSIEAFAAVTEALGGQVERIKTSEKLAALVDVQHTIHEYEFCHHLSETLNTHWDQVSDTLKPIVQRGRKISQSEYEDALVVMDSAETFFEEFFHDYDAVIAPSATGEAPKFGDSTGDPIFCTIWNLAGLPCVTMPLLVGETGLPIGVQLIGAKEEDDRLLRTANWVLNELKAEA
ncbi:amidase [Pseudohalocynthiibacter aestuariivivens]|jgi:Asp-tRNA(Asn)/Glu-tRNA(Gln) amidotransferase A subunit family amidase|uniref:Amidase n=1 Tax=Pseudohalocynthiibacter aestuariivivens TaxID=1591409 RepID=A0ABV5JL13_9RHOB|nr:MULTISPECIES: amidase [Pseudohalocynthiibacter]MBS9716617.1 amidase [Pseudohalocynthiibacter aestuariivivens]MCK0101699.1 amidase [Pseudohalocynthiibacter sp. F2068]